MIRPLSILPLLLLIGFAAQASAGEAFRYPEARHGGGELRYIDHIPVVVLEGSPAEIGDQLGVLVLTPAGHLLDQVNGFVERNGWQKPYSLVSKTSHIFLPLFPPDHAAELTAAAEASSWPRELLIFANTIADLRRLVGCSAFIVNGDRSQTGGPIFGRNLDWPPFGTLHELTFVAIYRQPDKRCFASVTFPGLIGCGSGMNDAGLAVALLDATCDKPGAVNYNPLGTPTNLLLRRVLEECATVDEAVRLLESAPRASSMNVALCDQSGGIVCEITPQQVRTRAAVEGICICTNHFRTEELATDTFCWRYNSLAEDAESGEYDVQAVAQRMDLANQGEMTLQSMVFEPASLRLHLAFGKGPATRLPRGVLELSSLLKRERAAGSSP